MSAYTPLNIPGLEKNYKKNSTLTFYILILVVLTLAVLAVIGFLLIQRSSS